MLSKILFTAFVIVVVYMVYRGRTTATSPARRPAPAPADNRFGRRVAYGFVGVLIGISAIFYYLHWREQHRVITIRVIDGRSGNATTYKAYKKSINGSRFEALDGRTVILGEAERVELIETQ